MDGRKSLYTDSPGEDRRTKYTKMVLCQSLLELMHDKEISRITVTEICRRADINRNTFYKYYYGPEDLLTTIENRFIEMLTGSLGKIEDIEQVSRDLLQIILDNKEFSQVILSEHGNQDFLKRLLHLTRRAYLDAWKAQVPPSLAPQVEKIYRFGEGGLVAVISEWVRGGFREPPEAIVEYFSLANSLIKSRMISS